MTAGQPDVTYRWPIPIEGFISTVFTENGYVSPSFNTVAVGGDTTTDMLGRVASVTALNPDHVFIMCGINDHFNHNGTPIPLATTKANLLAYFAALKLARPSVRIHVISGVWYLGENWPLGVNGDDGAVTWAMNAEQAAVALEPQAEYIDIRTIIFAQDEPYYNPTHQTSGVITQGSGDGTHPAKPLGQHVLSLRVFQQMTFGV